MSSFHQKDLSILQEAEMRYEAEALLDHQDIINDGSGQNDIQSMEANSPWVNELNPHQSIQRLLLNFNQVVCERLDAIERRLDGINEFCQTLEEKVEMLSSLMKESNNPFLSSSTSSESINSVENGAASVSVGSNFTLITLNSEADYPNGSWLGDESNPDMKVRTHISPTDLFHINTTCHTAEKMALTLLDYLFDRETQACSNISGTGKHKKKQLDPLMIYGIRCHLMHKFNLSNYEWNRIKQNLDSKCRTAFRRKQKGLPLLSKGQVLSPSDSTEISMDKSVPVPEETLCNNEELSNGESIQLPSHCLQFSLQSEEQQDLQHIIPDIQVIQTAHGQIQVLQATPEQIVQIQQTHQIQFLNGAHFLATPTDQAANQLGFKNEEALSTFEDRITSPAE